MNKVVLIGNLTRDPSLTYAAGSGTAISKFTVATARPFKRDESDFINCTAFGKTAETISQYLAKGKKIALTGSIRTGSYEKDGIKHYTTEVAVESFEFVGTGGGNHQDGNSSNESFNGSGFNEDITPVDDETLPF